MLLSIRIALGLALLLCLSASVLGQQQISIDARALARDIDRQLAGPSVKSMAVPAAMVDLPWFGDDRIRLSAVPASQFASELQAKYPDLRSFRVMDAKGQYYGRLNTGPEGVFLVLIGEDGAVEIEHELVGDEVTHTLRRIDLREEMEAFTCGVSDDAAEETEILKSFTKDNSCFQVGATLRSYRLALTNTGEFAAANGGTLVGVNTAFNNRLAELNTIYERELAITFQLIAGNDVLVNLNAGNDPFPNPNNTSESLADTKAYIEGLIDPADYDIGHGIHVSPGGGAAGIAGIGVVCQTGQKARGYSTIFNGSALVILQHEIGHQFGCRHTNYGCGNTGAQRYEPGEGVSIMGTGAGCSAADTYDGRNNTYFNVGSLQAIENLINSSAGCFTPVNIGNQEPSSDASAATGKVIPARTAFVLEGSGSDANNNNLTYNWEQFDTDINTTQPPTVTNANTTAPLFRSFAPVSAPARYLPRLQTILDGETPDGADGEILPTVDRSLTFRLTVRDGLTGNACDEASIQVIDTGEPFRITSQNSERTWRADGSNTETVTWDVAGTADGAINTPNVDILLSTDGGRTFPIILAAATPNDGSHTFTVPALTSTTGRVMVRGTGNIFLDINDANITLTDDGSVCDAGASFVSPAGEIMTVAGDPSLNLGLSPRYGERLISPITFNLTAADDSGNSIAEDSTGACIELNFQGYFEPLTVVSLGGGMMTFNATGNNESDGFIPHTSLFNLPYAGTCNDGGFIGSTATIKPTQTGSFRISRKGFVGTLTPGEEYDLVAYGNNSGATGNVVVSFEGGTLYTVAAAPGNEFLYTYGIVRNSTGNILAFDPNSDLSDAGEYPDGAYTVFGLSYEAGTDLSTYVGGSRQTLENDIAADRVCAARSDNEVSINISDASLPVELVSFTGRREGVANVLEWATAAEIGTEKFELQRRGAGQDEWVMMESIAAENRAATYTANDHVHINRDSYYRLRIVDFDGYTEYSDVVFLAGSVGDAVVGVYPNPVSAGDVLNLTGLTDGALRVELVDVAGRVVHSVSSVATDGGVRFALPAGLVGGVYFVRVGGDGVVWGERVVVW